MIRTDKWLTQLTINSRNCLKFDGALTNMTLLHTHFPQSWPPKLTVPPQFLVDQLYGCRRGYLNVVWSCWEADFTHSLWFVQFNLPRKLIKSEMCPDVYFHNTGCLILFILMSAFLRNTSLAKCLPTSSDGLGTWSGPGISTGEARAHASNFWRTWRARTFYAPVMVNINSHAINNCIRTWTRINAQPQCVINHQSQPLHNKNGSKCLTVTRSPCLPLHPPLARTLHCAVLLPAVSLTLVLAVLVLAEAALDFKNKLAGLQQFFTVSQQCSLRFLSLSPPPPCVAWCLDSFFC